MADNQAQLEILIKTIADTTGFQVTKEQAMQVQGVLDKNGTSMSELARQTSKGTQTQEEFNIKGRAQFMLFSEINKILPGLGTALHAAFTGPLAPLLMLTFAIGAAHAALKSYNDDLDKQGEAAIQPIVDAVQNVQAAWENTVESVAKYRAALTSAGGDNDPIAREIKNIRELTKARLDGIKQVITALGEQEQARLSAEGASPEQLSAAKERTRRQNESLNFAGSQSGVTALELEYQRRSAPGYQQSLDTAQSTTATAAAEAGKKVAEMKQRLDTLNPPAGQKTAAQARLDEIDKIQSAFDDFVNLRADKEALGTVASWAYGNGMDILKTGPAAAGAKAGEELKSDREKAEAQLRQEKMERDQLRRNLPGAEQAKAEAEDRAANAAKAGEENRARTRQLPNETRQARQISTASNAEGILERGGAAESAVVAGERLNTDQIAAIGELKALFEQAGGNMAMVVRIVQSGAAMHESQQQRLTALEQKYLQLQSNQSHHGP